MKIIGAHFSIQNGLGNAIRNAEKCGCNALQIFTGNPMGWQAKILSANDISDFLKAKKETGISNIISHSSYLINLASPEKRKIYLSKKAMAGEIKRCQKLGIKYLVLHPGSYIKGSEQNGLKRIVENINLLYSKSEQNFPLLLVETMAGQGTNLGDKFEHIAYILQNADKKNRIGVCFDTCHSFAAGYDIRNIRAYNKTIKEFDKIIGLDNLKLIHLNDSKCGLGSRIDRHQNIGKGKIGIEAFKLIIRDKRLKNVPKILETPFPGVQNDLKILISF